VLAGRAAAAEAESANDPAIDAASQAGVPAWRGLTRHLPF
jgi:hypothetical protein